MTEDDYLKLLAIGSMSNLEVSGVLRTAARHLIQTFEERHGPLCALPDDGEDWLLGTLKKKKPKPPVLSGEIVQVQ